MHNNNIRLIVLIFYVVPLLFVDTSDSGAVCENPLGKKGLCVPLVNCSSLAASLKQQPTSDANLFFLQKSLCGVDAQTLQSMVCCSETHSISPEEGKGTGPESSITSTTNNPNSFIEEPDSLVAKTDDIGNNGEEETTTTTTTTTESTIVILESVKYHRNIHLLPNIRLCGYNTASTRIVGGEAAGLGTYPWMALIAFKVSRGPVQYGCAGTLISQRYILSAAHCFENLPKDPVFTPDNIVIGEYDKSKAIDCDDLGVCAPPPQTIPIQEIVVHESYNKYNRIENDIALVRLARDAILGPFVAPICLPTDEDILMSMKFDKQMYAAGWGRTSWDNEDNSDVLQDVVVPLVPNDKCQRTYREALAFQSLGPGRFCAGGVKGKDSCHGDSGGPLMETLNVPSLRNQTRVFQFGIVSMGPGAKCGEENKPSLYTRVTYYMKWILDHLKADNENGDQ